MVKLAVIKFSSTHCSTCQEMSRCDRAIAEQLGLEFIDIKLQDTMLYRQYRHILLAQYPRKVGMGWPTYLVCKSPEADFQILGEIKGGHSQEAFRSQLEAIVGKNA